MKKRFSKAFVLICVLASPMFMQSCAPARWYLVNSEGILTYNRHTGQLEIVWSHHSEGAQVDTTKVSVDSVVNKK